MLGIIADHAASEQEVMTQRRAAKEPPGTPAREALARQAQRVPDRRAQDRTGNLVDPRTRSVPSFWVGQGSLLLGVHGLGQTAVHDSNQETDGRGVRLTITAALDLDSHHDRASPRIWAIRCFLLSSASP